MAPAAISIDNFDPSLNDRFSGVSSTSFIGNPYDWSGVGRVNERWVTMIDENIFLSAEHFAPVNGGTAVFYPDNNPASTPITRTVVNGTQLCGSDLYVGFLDFAVGPTIKKYGYATTPINNITDFNNTIENNYIFQPGVSLTNTGYGGPSQTDMALGENHVEQYNFNQTIDGSTGDVIIAVNNEPGDSGFTYETHDADVNVGDSGAPLMHIVGSDLEILGITWAEGTATIGGGVGMREISFYTYTGHDPACLQELSTFVSDNINVIVPEPSSLGMLFLGTLMIFRRGRK